MEQEPNNTNTVVSLPPGRPKWLVPAIVAAAIVAAGIVIFLLLSGGEPAKKPTTSTEVVKGPKNFAMTTSSSVPEYAGHAVYDACNLISFDTIRATVNNYQKILDMNGTDQKPSEPLTIEHYYVDRDIASALGKDAQPRPTATKIGADKVADANSFLSNSDSNCWYGQGNNLSSGGGKIFAKVYVTQKPTPLSNDLLRYLGTLKPAGSQAGVDVFVEAKTDAGGFFTSIAINKQRGAAAFVKTSSRELARKAAVEAGEKLTENPTAPMNLTYPLGWVRMPNPCMLLTADDFRQATGRSTGALAEDTLTLNEIGGRMMQRTCERLELERLDGSPISKTNVTVRMGNSEKAAKDYVEFLRTDEASSFTMHQLKQSAGFADDAYVATTQNGQKVTSYEFHMRIGQAVIVLAVENEGKLDASADAFADRVLPLAQKIAERYKDSIES